MKIVIDIAKKFEEIPRGNKKFYFCVFFFEKIMTLFKFFAGKGDIIFIRLF